MPDLSKVPDDELLKLAGVTPDSPASSMSNEDLLKAAGVEEPSTPISQQASDFTSSVVEGIPGYGIAEKAGRFARAGLMKGEENIRQALGQKVPDVPYADILKRITEKDEADRAARFGRSKAASIAGEVTGAIAAPNPGTVIGRVLMNIADAASRGNTPEEIEKNAKTSGLISAGVESIPVLGKGLKFLGARIGDAAENLAVKATGATGKQSEKFAETAGRELLDQGVVKAFSSPKTVAGRAAKQLQASYDEIDSSLKALDQAGANITRDDIIQGLNKEREKLLKSPSKAASVDFLDKRIAETQAGPEIYLLSEAEAEKRAYQHQANYDLDNISQDIKKKVANVWRQAVEQRATEINPKLAEMFKVGKQRFGIFAPIEQAAAKRVAQLNQSPFGGLLDMATIGAGGIAAGQTNSPENLLLGMGAAAARRAVAPRLASTAAKAADVSAQALNKAGGIAQILPKSTSRAAMHLGLKLPQ